MGGIGVQGFKGKASWKAGNFQSPSAIRKEFPMAGVEPWYYSDQTRFSQPKAGAFDSAQRLGGRLFQGLLCPRFVGSPLCEKLPSCTRSEGGH